MFSTQNMQNYQFTPHFPISLISVKCAGSSYTENILNFHNYFPIHLTHELWLISHQFNFYVMSLCMLYRKYIPINPQKIENAERNTEINGKGRRNTLPHVYEPRSTQLTGQTRSMATKLQATLWNLYQNDLYCKFSDFPNCGNLQIGRASCRERV